MPELAGDAWIRIGFFHFLVGANAEAHAAFARAESAAGAGAGTRYLTHLFSAWMSERAGKHDTAIDEFAAAIDAAPYGRTAAVRLAGRYQIAGRESDAKTVAMRSLETSGNVRGVQHQKTDPVSGFHGPRRAQFGAVDLA